MLPSVLSIPNEYYAYTLSLLLVNKVNKYGTHSPPSPSPKWINVCRYKKVYTHDAVIIDIWCKCVDVYPKVISGWNG